MGPCKNLNIGHFKQRRKICCCWCGSEDLLSSIYPLYICTYEKASFVINNFTLFFHMFASKPRKVSLFRRFNLLGSNQLEFEI
jgi:hypothetical protein